MGVGFCRTGGGGGIGAPAQRYSIIIPIKFLATLFPFPRVRPFIHSLVQAGRQAGRQATTIGTDRPRKGPKPRHFPCHPCLAPHRHSVNSPALVPLGIHHHHHQQQHSARTPTCPTCRIRSVIGQQPQRHHPVPEYQSTSVGGCHCRW